MTATARTLVELDQENLRLHHELSRTVRNERAVTALRTYLAKEERGGASHVGIVAVRMILGKI